MAHRHVCVWAALVLQLLHGHLPLEVLLARRQRAAAPDEGEKLAQLLLGELRLEDGPEPADGVGVAQLVRDVRHALEELDVDRAAADDGVAQLAPREELKVARWDDAVQAEANLGDLAVELVQAKLAHQVDVLCEVAAGQLDRSPLGHQVVSQTVGAGHLEVKVAHQSVEHERGGCDRGRGRRRRRGRGSGTSRGHRQRRCC